MNQGKPIVLVVDDHADIRQALDYLLSDAGFDVLQASHGAEALDHLRGADGARIRVILLDQSMPRVDGRGLIDALRHDASLSAIPMILMSAAPMIEPRVLPAVFGGFFLKPFDIDALIEAVRHWSASVGLAALLGATLAMPVRPQDQLEVDEGPDQVEMCEAMSD